MEFSQAVGARAHPLMIRCPSLLRESHAESHKAHQQCSGDHAVPEAHQGSALGHLERFICYRLEKGLEE